VFNYTGGTIRNNVIANNRVYPAAGTAPTYGGGGVWIWQNLGTAQKIVENNTIVGNSVSGSGGGGFGGRGGGILVAGTTAIIRNNIVRENTQVLGGQIGITSGGVPVVSFSNIEGGYAGTGNVDTTAMFADSSFYLLAGSPCIDAGDSNSVFNDPEDLMNPGFALWPALGGLRNDMGAYGGPGSAPLGSFPVTDVNDGGSGQVPHRYLLEQNYPNPFNPETEIGYQVPEARHVILKIYDLVGREVATLVNEIKSPGRHEVTWDASGLASGIYLYRMQAGEYVATKKFVVLK
jgi:hypothetical protein